MEPEHVKVSNENVQKISDGMPLMDMKNQDLPSDLPQKQTDGRLSSSSQPIALPDMSQMPQSNEVRAPSYVKTSLQNSPPESPAEPAVVSPDFSPMKSPPIQTMGHLPGYDPSRIPSSVFSSKPANPSECSATSNESLFSIQMGNNNFSRDYTIPFGKSGELPWPEDSQSSPFSIPGDYPRLEERSNLQSDSQSATQDKSNEPSNSTSSLPLVMESPSHEHGILSLSKHSRTEKEDDNKSPEVAHKAHAEDHTKEKSTHEKPIPAPIVDTPVASPKSLNVKNTPPAEFTPPMPSTPTSFPSLPRSSDESGNSGNSFAFPVLVNDGTRSSTGSLKVVPKEPEEPQSLQPQPQSESKSQREDAKDPKEALNAVSRRRWCSCFPCLRRRC